MAIAHESQGGVDTGNSGTQLTWSHTIGGSDRFLVVALGGAVSDSHVTDVTVGSAAAFRIGRMQRIGSDTHYVDVWGLIAPATGAQTITVNFSAALNDHVGSSSNYTGVDQSAPLVTADRAEGQDTNAIIVLASKTNDVVVAVGFHDDTNTFTIDSGTERWQEDPISNDGGLALADIAGGASVTIDWDLDGAEEWCIVGFSLQPVGTYTAGILPVSVGEGAVDTTGDSSIAWDHVISSETDSYLVMTAGCTNIGTLSGMTCKIDGSDTGISLLGYADNDPEHCFTFGIKDPPTGTINIVITFGEAVADICANSAYYSGVDQTTPTGTTATATGTGTATTGSVSSASGELVVDACWSPGAESGLDSGDDATPVSQIINVPENGWMGQSFQPGETITSMDWQIAVSDNWAWVGVPLKPAAAGDTTIAVPQDSLSETDNAPDIQAPIAVPQDSLTETDNDPALNTGVNVPVPQDSLTETDNAPSVPQIVGVPQDSLSHADQVPDIRTGATVGVPADTLAQADNDPGVNTGVTIEPPQDSLSQTDNAPSIGSGTQIDAPQDSLAQTDNDPALNTGVTVEPPQDSLAQNDNAPLANTGVLIRVPADTLSVVDNAPDIATGARVDAPADALTIADQAPGVAIGVKVITPQDIFTLVDNAPVIIAAAGPDTVAFTAAGPEHTVVLGLENLTALIAAESLTQVLLPETVTVLIAAEALTLPLEPEAVTAIIRPFKT